MSTIVRVLLSCLRRSMEPLDCICFGVSYRRKVFLSSSHTGQSYYLHWLLAPPSEVVVSLPNWTCSRSIVACTPELPWSFFGLTMLQSCSLSPSRVTSTSRHRGHNTVVVAGGAILVGWHLFYVCKLKDAIESFVWFVGSVVRWFVNKQMATVVLLPALADGAAEWGCGFLA
jgi:hypothetical protein